MRRAGRPARDAPLEPHRPSGAQGTPIAGRSSLPDAVAACLRADRLRRWRSPRALRRPDRRPAASRVRSARGATVPRGRRPTCASIATGAGAARRCAGGPWPFELEGLTLELRPDRRRTGRPVPGAPRACSPGCGPRVARRAAAGRPPAVLHLFAYTGLATLAMADAGAAADPRRCLEADRRLGAPQRRAVRPCRVDRSAGSSTTRSASPSARPDAVGATPGIVLDPPTYGHGPGARPWRLEEDLPRLLDGLRPGDRARWLRAPDGAHARLRRRAADPAASTTISAGRAATSRAATSRSWPPTAGCSSSARSREPPAGHDGGDALPCPAGRDQPRQSAGQGGRRPARPRGSATGPA